MAHDCTVKHTCFSAGAFCRMCWDASDQEGPTPRGATGIVTFGRHLKSFGALVSCTCTHCGPNPTYSEHDRSKSREGGGRGLAYDAGNELFHLTKDEESSPKRNSL